MHDGQMAIISGALFVYNAPTFVTEVLFIDPKAPAFVCKIDTKSLKITDKLLIYEKSTVAFAKNSILVMYADRIERYNSNFKLINPYTLPEYDYTAIEDWWDDKLFAVDEDYLLYSHTLKSCPTLLNIVTGETSLMPLLVIDGQEFTYWPKHLTGNSIIVCCFCYEKSANVFINWKTGEIVDVVYSVNAEDAVFIKSLSNLTLYELRKPYVEFNMPYPYNPELISYSGCYYTSQDFPLSIFDCVNKAKLDFPTYNGKRFYVNAILQAEDEQVFLLINLNDKKKSIFETYLYRMN